MTEQEVEKLEQNALDAVNALLDATKLRECDQEAEHAFSLIKARISYLSYIAQGYYYD